MVSACLLALDVLMLRGVISRHSVFPIAICATTTWLMAAWRTSLADRERQRRPRVVVAAGVTAMSLLLVLAHALASTPVAAGSFKSQVRWHIIAADVVIGLLIGALTAGGSALMCRLEPTAVVAARARWRRSRKEHHRAQRQMREDVRAASAARKAWLDHVRRQADALATDSDPLDQRPLAAELRAEARLAIDRRRRASD